MKFEFERIDASHQRAKVLGGWLVKAFEGTAHFTEERGVIEDYDWRIAMAFVPDPHHEWKIT